MKKTFVVLMMLLGLTLQAQQPATFQSATPPPRPAGSPTVSNFAPNTRMFLKQWNEYQNAWQAAQATKSAQLEQTAQTHLSQLTDAYGLRTVKSAKGAARYELPVFVRFESEAALQTAVEKGLKVNTKLQTICTGVIAPEDLPALNGLGGIRYVETSTKATPSLDSARIFSQVDAVHQGGSPYGTNENEVLAAHRGEGVVVGIVDQGFDYTHPTFYDPFDQSVYRVKRVWDQMAEDGSAPKGYDYGVEYTTTADILAAQHDHWENASHGSHVAGIAGGSGAGTPYGGMAPKSDLVFVPTTMFTDGIFDGIQYIKDYAGSQQKPCVVNLSIGSNFGPHDGTSLFDQACDELKSDGFILVGAAGNQGSRPLYLQHRFTALTQDTVMYSCIEFLNSDDKEDWLDIWSDNDDDFYICIGLLHPSGEFISETKPFASYMTDTTQHLREDDEIAVTIDLYSEHNPANGKARIAAYIDASPLNGDDFEGYAIVMMLGSTRTDRTMSAQMWLNDVGKVAIFTKTGYEDHPLFKAGGVTHTVDEIGGTGNSIITVGAYESRYQWPAMNGSTYHWTDGDHTPGHIAPFSSHGPTADDRMKPDIAAPGCAIISAYNSFDEASEDMVFMVDEMTRNDRTYRFGIMQGTSMASPAAAGIIALWLQASPTLSMDQVKDMLKETALNYPDVETPGRPEYTWGYGKIDALAGLQYIFRHKLDSPLRVTTEQAQDLTPRSATLYLSVQNLRDAELGFYYHTEANAEQGLYATAVLDKDNIYKAEIKNLNPYTRYYFKAVGSQGGETVYGEALSFRTLAEPLAVTTVSAGDITARSAILYLMADNATEEARFGFYYNTQAEAEQGTYVAAVLEQDNIYKAEINHLEPNTDYHFKAVGTQEGETVYGQSKSFRTLDNSANEAVAATEPLTVYPNPVSETGELTVELPFDPTDAWLKLTDMSGKTLKTIPVSSRKIILTDLKAGFYILQTDRPTANGNVRYQAKVIVK